VRDFGVAPIEIDRSGPRSVTIRQQMAALSFLQLQAYSVPAWARPLALQVGRR
jgi:hypothetical protein